MRYLLGLGTMITVIFQSANAAQAMQNEAVTAQPTTCISTQFSATGSQYWKDIVLQLTNKCDKTVEFQNATVSFQSNSSLNTAFWGDFSPLSYPKESSLNITSQDLGGGKFLATFRLDFPSDTGSNSKLPAGKTIAIKYGAEKEGHIEGTTHVYLGEVVVTGNIKLTNAAKPTGVAQTYALVHLTMNGQAIKDVNLPWGSSQPVSGVAAGSYAVSAESITEGSATYRGTATPSTLIVTANQTATSNIAYAVVQQTGKISVKLLAQPTELTGYTLVPSVLLTQKDTGSSISKSVPWNNTTTVSQLKAGSVYSFSTAKISYNNFTCTPTFSPAFVAANATTTPLTTLSYQCVQMTQDSVTLGVKGAPASLTSLKITLTPNDSTAAVTQTVNLTNGTGSSTLQLTEGSIYTVSADPVAGYTFNFSPQPLTVSANVTETITLSPQSASSGGKIIGYIPGWKTPPPATELAAAGYTHVMIAFGVFSTTTPGEITPAFDMVSKAYIQTLHAAGIKVILSLGGASSSLPYTSVDFNKVLTMAASPKAFTDKFSASLTNLMTSYGFDGFDIDIEHGINAGGTFANPQGDIAALATIINGMYAQNPKLLITLTPQIANISATSNFDATWGNYASLVMQTHKSLAWVGIQLYNAGCAYGVDKVCYDVNVTSSPNATVAMAVDLLANWPAGFQPYVASLTPSQIVLGYPSPDASGASDGAPVTPNSTIIKAIQCLKTQTSCGTYIPPKAYGAIGGVFNWEVTYDQLNGFKFAKELKNCVINGVCN